SVNVTTGPDGALTAVASDTSSVQILVRTDNHIVFVDGGTPLADTYDLATVPRVTFGDGTRSVVLQRNAAGNALTLGGMNIRQTGFTIGGSPLGVSVPVTVPNLGTFTFNGQISGSTWTFSTDADLNIAGWPLHARLDLTSGSVTVTASVTIPSLNDT